MLFASHSAQSTHVKSANQNKKFLCVVEMNSCFLFKQLLVVYDELVFDPATKYLIQFYKFEYILKTTIHTKTPTSFLMFSLLSPPSSSSSSPSWPLPWWNSSQVAKRKPKSELQKNCHMWGNCRTPSHRKRFRKASTTCKKWWLNCSAPPRWDVTVLPLYSVFHIEA